MKAILLSVLAVSIVGCTSIVKRENGTFDVPRQVEARSLFGTNQAGMRIENCKQETFKLLLPNEYTQCETVVDYDHAIASSQGQGGQIVSGALTGLGMGLGLAFSGDTVKQKQSNTTDVRASTVNPNPPKK